MENLYIKSRAKINLTLNILDKRPDNYHNLESVMQIIGLYDELYITKNNTNTFTFSCDVEILDNSDNIICKTYNIMKEKFDCITGIDVKLLKHIPFEAGLGGASSDCAAFLIALNKLFNLNLTTTQLIDIAKLISADAPACLNRGAILATGIGENIELIDSNMKYYIVIIKPEINFSTPKMFQIFDELNLKSEKNNSSTIISALKSGNISLLSKTLHNSFEDVLSKDSEVFTLKNLLIDNGAVATLMSGAGSCVYGIFDNKEIAKSAYNILKKSYNVFYTIPTKRNEVENV